MKSLTQTYFIKSPQERVWASLTEPHHIEDWTGSFAIMNATAGGEFKLWDGEIFGKNTEVIKPVRLAQDWYAGNWPAPSNVRFVLNEKDGGTEITLTQENIPDNEYKDIEKGWKDYYFGPLKKYTENLI